MKGMPEEIPNSEQDDPPEVSASQPNAAHKADTVSAEDHSRQQAEDDAAIASIKESLDDPRGISRRVHPAVLQSLTDYQRECLREELRMAEKEFCDDPALWEQYRALLLEGDRDALRRKSLAQAGELQEVYFGATSEPRMWNIRARRERREKEDRLERFRQLVRSLKPVRGDRRNASVFESPRRTGNISSFGSVDVLVQADNYVYASFDRMGHHMSREGRRIDERDIEERAEIVMQDAAEISTRAENGKCDFLRSYLRNMFDYENGKEILALYFALIFESPEEARRFIEAYAQRAYAENWEEYIEGETRGNDGGIIPAERTAEIVRGLKELHKRFGLEPPLTIEIRIPDAAKTLQSEEGPVR